MTGRRWRFGDPVRPLAEHLERGGVVAIPTESSYGLAVLPGNRVGLDAVYRLKVRDEGKPLPVVAGSVDQLEQLGIDVAGVPVRQLAERWPAALTAVLPIGAELPAAAGTGTIAVRIPAHEGLRGLLLELGTPLTATSANLAGSAPVLDPGELTRALPGWDGWVVDGGPLPGGPPSTIVRWEGDGWSVLRPGPEPPPGSPDER